MKLHVSPASALKDHVVTSASTSADVVADQFRMGVVRNIFRSPVLWPGAVVFGSMSLYLQDVIDRRPGDIDLAIMSTGSGDHPGAESVKHLLDRARDAARRRYGFTLPKQTLIEAARIDLVFDKHLSHRSVWSARCEAVVRVQGVEDVMADKLLRLSLVSAGHPRGVFRAHDVSDLLACAEVCFDYCAVAAAMLRKMIRSPDKYAAAACNLG